MTKSTVIRLFFLIVLVIPGLAGAAAKVSPLSPSDARQLDYQRTSIRDLSALHLGRRLGSGKERDLATLQALLDQNVVKSGETRELQSMGVVLGDLIAQQLDMDWVVYEDQYGRSRALQLGPSENFLFPITMISRRIDNGIPVNIIDIYNKAIAEMEPYIATRYRRNYRKLPE